jgi:PEP-CTERM motif
MKSSLALVALLLFAGVSRADSVWTYTGNTMNFCNCSLNGAITLDSSGDATAWDFTDGTHELKTANSVMEEFSEHNDFSLWKVVIVDSFENTTVGFLTEFYGSAFEATDGAGGPDFFGYLEGNHGVWTESVPASEPETLALIGVGLAGLLARKRLRAGRSQVPEAVWEPLA